MRRTDIGIKVQPELKNRAALQEEDEDDIMDWGHDGDGTNYSPIGSIIQFPVRGKSGVLVALSPQDHKGAACLHHFSGLEEQTDCACNFIINKV